MSQIEILETSHTYFYVLTTLEDLTNKLDQIHSTISEGGFQAPSSVHTETTDWLREILYLASETLNELERENTPANGFKVVDGHNVQRSPEPSHKESGTRSNPTDTPLTLPAIRKLGS